MTSTLIKTGQISLIIGSMFSGKSTELLRQLNIYSRCYKTVFVTHSIDTRSYISHNPTINTNLLNTKIEYVQCSKLDTEKLLTYDVIGIDEGQFFTNLKEPILELIKNEKIIIVAGLDSDFNQNVFKELIDLIPYAVEVKKLTALCNKCISEKNNIINSAPVTIRISDNKERLVVGQEEIYSVSCLKHMSKTNQ